MDQSEERLGIEAQAPVVSHKPSQEIGTQIGTVVAVGVAAALIETELIPGILLGAAAVLAARVFPRLGTSVRPLVKGTVRAGYSLAGKTRETFAEASEQFQDIVAEVKAEKHPAATARSRGAGEAGASGQVA